MEREGLYKEEEVRGANSGVYYRLKDVQYGTGDRADSLKTVNGKQPLKIVYN